VAVDPSGKFAYVANFDNSFSGGTLHGTVSEFTINATTGALTPISGSPFATAPEPISVAVDASGKFAYVANYNSAPSTVSGLAINPMTGALTTIAGSPFTAGFAPVSVAVAIQQPTFSAFSARLEISTTGFQLNGSFTLGAGRTINPPTQSLTLQVGTYKVTLPPGSFQAGSHGTFTFQGTVGGVSLQNRISPAGAGAYQIQVEASGVNLSGLTNPVTVSLAIGNNTGKTSVNAQFQ
jgi:DNA-binding beta-propeller fold protein YncE